MEDGNALAEYIILMLVNGKTQEQIAAELSNELLSLPPDDPSSHNFAAWLFEQIETLNAQINGQAAAPAPQPDAAGGEMDTDMGAGEATDINMYVPFYKTMSELVLTLPDPLDPSRCEMATPVADARSG